MTATFAAHYKCRKVRLCNSTYDARSWLSEDLPLQRHVVAHPPKEDEQARDWTLGDNFYTFPYSKNNNYMGRLVFAISTLHMRSGWATGQGLRFGGGKGKSVPKSLGLDKVHNLTKTSLICCQLHIQSHCYTHKLQWRNSQFSTFHNNPSRRQSLYNKSRSNFGRKLDLLGL